MIPSGGKPYLVRVYLASWRGWRLYLHRFISADGERWVHDHPFSGVAVILRGGYDEAVVRALGAGEQIRRRRWWNRIPDHRLHRIVSVLPGTWTLFVHGRHRHRWGFLQPVSDGKSMLVYHNPFDQSQSGGARWWEAPGCAVYPPPEVMP